MLCKNCGTEINENLKFCPVCGNSNINNSVEGSLENGSLDQMNLDSVQNNSVDINTNVNGFSQSSFGEFGNGNVQQTPNMGFGVQPETMVNPINNAPVMNNNDAKNGSKGLIIIIVGIVVALIVCIVIIFGASKKNNNNNNSNSTSNSNITSNSNSNTTSNVPTTSNTPTTSNVPTTSNTPTTSNVPTTNNTPTTNTPVTNANVVSFGGYSLQIPSTYTSTVVGTQLQLIGTNNKDVAVLGIQTGSYNSIKASKTTIQTYMQNSGYAVKNIQVKVYNGVEFVTAEASKDGKNMILGYANLGNGKIFMVVTANTLNTIDYTALNEIATIVKTAKLAA